MYNWLIINTIGFFIGILSSICVNFICRRFYPIIYNHYYSIYVAIQIIIASYAGSRVCRWYGETMARYHIQRRSSMISASGQFFYYIPVTHHWRKLCIKKLNESHMD